MTTSSNRDGSRRKTRGSASRSAPIKRRTRKPAERPRRPVVEEPTPEPVEPALPEIIDESQPLPVPVSRIESAFAARVPPPEPERPRPPGRRAIFLDVENTSRAQHLAHVIDHLGVDPWDRRTELVAVANWRVVGHESARLLAARGAHLVHSAPSTGVRDWSDLRIAVAAGIWLASARPGDVIEVVSDDRAFDAVGDVAASLGIEFRRLSYRRLREQSAAETPEEPESPPEPPASASGSRRRRRRRGRGPGGPPVSGGERRHSDSRDVGRSSGPAPSPPHGRSGGGRRRPSGPPASRPQPEPSHTTAPHDELVSVVREMVEASPRRAVSIDAVANALKARGFQRPPGSPRLVTRLRRIRELLVSPSGVITLAEDGAPSSSQSRVESAPIVESEPPRHDDEAPAATEPAPEIEDDDRQPAYLSHADAEEEESPEIDGNRAESRPSSSQQPPPARSGSASSSGRRRRRRRWRGGPRQPATGPSPG